MGVKVLAIIIQQQKILVHSFNKPSYPWLRLPGGGVEAGESLEAAVVREIWEETGIRGVKIGRKVGILNYISPMDGQPRERHCFIVHPSEPLPEKWDHTVTGDGDDAAHIFSHFWIGQEAFARVDATLLPILTLENLPELK